MTAPTTPGSNDPLNALVLTAMMQALDQNKRDELIRKALSALITPAGAAGYGQPRPTSPLEDAFNMAVRDVARGIVTEMVNTEEIRVQIRTLCTKAVEKAMAEPDAIVDKMVSALTTAAGVPEEVRAEIRAHQTVRDFIDGKLDPELSGYYVPNPFPTSSAWLVCVGPVHEVLNR